MKPHEKYMSQPQVNLDDSDIKFVPPVFMESRFYDNSYYDFNLDLFSSEIGFPELCYYSDESNDTMSRNSNITIYNEIQSTFDILRNLDINSDETEELERVYSNSDINEVYSKIEKRHPGIFATLYSYRIPRSIVRVIIKRLVRLTLLYYNQSN